MDFFPTLARHGPRLLGQFTLIVDRATLKQARADDVLYVAEPEHLGFFQIHFANLISKLGKKLQLRQRVISTAIVFFHRFYLKNSYCETDPYLVLSACCYVAAKAEESPVHIKNVVSESRTLFNQQGPGKPTFPSDNSKLAEMEFYLVDDLECDLVVFHPYRTLLALCRKDAEVEAEAGELGTGIGAEDGPRYWGSGRGKLKLSEGALQTAWFTINDTYRSQLCLLYPPHLIAISAIYLTLVLHTPTQNTIFDETTTRRQDPVAFLADLNVSLSVISTISQEIIALYSLWSEEPGAVPGPGIEAQAPSQQQQRFPSPYGTLSPAMTKRVGGGSGSGTPESQSRTGLMEDLFGEGSFGSPSSQQSAGATPGAGTGTASGGPEWRFGYGHTITPLILPMLLKRMREQN
ncbi:cyclin-like protein [Gymnopus androsaceus JB14]|uniref:Cyclin-like protein n=1 Tax=Gymnopus androsaceus JB14 TaxID=1447944 RepID=A0A6A4H4T7_9AGAR|nr:cyclin-like protein [Gymnopus androsaceus JB14]